MVMITFGDNDYFNRDYLNMIEMEINNLKTINIRMIEVTPIEMEIYRGDLYGFLKSKNISPYMWYPTLRINSMINPIEFKDKQLLNIPDNEYINKILQQYKTIVDNIKT